MIESRKRREAERKKKVRKAGRKKRVMGDDRVIRLEIVREPHRVPVIVVNGRRLVGK